MKPNKIIIVGCSCTGKTSTGRLIEKELGLPHTDIDDLFWKPDWNGSTDEELSSKLEEVTSKEKWCLVGNYGRTNHITWPKADLIVWLNFPFPVVFRQSLYRTLKRIYTGEDICNGNKETFFKQFFTRESIIWWVIKTYKTNFERYNTRKKEKTYGDLPILEFYNHYEVRDWVESLKNQKL